MITLQNCNDGKDHPVIKPSPADSSNVEDSDRIDPAAVKADDYYDNFDSPFDTLIGCWAAIREGNINITFSKDSTFEFYDYNSTLEKQELLTGKFEIDGTTLTLFYKDRPKQRFTFKRDVDAANAYRITNASGYYFLKSHC
jgi:hypothetical protein